ncbi:helix-turn-helix transcriptional regulator [Amycolatopsis mongoliensis]|uniref:Helix-turn-helix transcriptional regulator n=1 Tax=Amycolatopsis mongoliensis TaxID=715475 RepID=A0A9Y2NLZ6_9PSEU|nr:helix-turn-helix transcriptional regulator [Amycolatopsis sp. 4-36]WIY02805.1 helix-turn-helix transcriptional regulator [Amycolatopsis sp. 4-36]
MAELEPVRFDDVDAGVFVPVGVLLRRVRDRRGWKQYDVADRSGFSPSFVGGVEAGSRPVRRVPTIMRLADVLDIPREQLFGWVVAEVEQEESGDERG